MAAEILDHTDEADLRAGASTMGLEHARELVQFFAEVTTSKDVEAFLAGFTDDCVVQYNQFPIMHGKDALRPFMQKILSPRRDFVCRKTLQCLSGNVIGAMWLATWTDSDSGKPKSGRGLEFWIMRGDQIARWDASFTAGDAEAHAA
jgi:ketosteroid isomerase-like protein